MSILWCLLVTLFINRNGCVFFHVIIIFLQFILIFLFFTRRKPRQDCFFFCAHIDGTPVVSVFAFTTVANFCVVGYSTISLKLRYSPGAPPTCLMVILAHRCILCDIWISFFVSSTFIKLYIHTNIPIFIIYKCND